MGILMTVVCNAVEIIYGPLWVSDTYNENWSFDSLDMWGLSIYFLFLFFFIYFIFLTHFRWFPSFARLHRLLAQVPPMVFFFSFLPRKVTGSFPPHFSLFFKGIFFFFSFPNSNYILFILSGWRPKSGGWDATTCVLYGWLTSWRYSSLSLSLTPSVSLIDSLRIRDRARGAIPSGGRTTKEAAACFVCGANKKGEELLKVALLGYSARLRSSPSEIGAPSLILASHPRNRRIYGEPSWCVCVCVCDSTIERARKN